MLGNILKQYIFLYFKKNFTLVYQNDPKTLKKI
jgi:hypothetical protein